MTFDREKHSFVAVDPATRQQLFVPLAELGQMVVREVERIESTPADLGPVRDELVRRMTDSFRAMQVGLKASFDAQLQAMRRELQTEIAVEHRRAIEALTVASALQDGRQIDPGSFPALERILRDTGRPVTSDEIIAAADEQARRSIELAGGL